MGRACSSRVRGETKVGRASLGRASVSPDMIAAMLARLEPEPHGGMCAAHRRSVQSRKVGRARLDRGEQRGGAPVLQTNDVVVRVHRPTAAGHPSHSSAYETLCAIVAKNSTWSLPKHLARALQLNLGACVH